MEKIKWPKKVTPYNNQYTYQNLSHTSYRPHTKSKHKQVALRCTHLSLFQSTPRIPFNHTPSILFIDTPTHPTTHPNTLYIHTFSPPLHSIHTPHPLHSTYPLSSHTVTHTHTHTPHTLTFRPHCVLFQLQSLTLHWLNV